MKIREANTFLGINMNHMTRARTKDFYIKSAGKKIYVQFTYPKKLPAPAIIVAHGLRSYYPGFLDMFAKAFVRQGYIAVKFHFVGTGKSDGKFEDKSTAVMLKNFEDVLDFAAEQEDVSGIGVMGRSNAGSLCFVHGPDPRIKAYVLLAPGAYYSHEMKKFIATAKKQGNYFVHKSFKRPHTKGPGRLPFSFISELKKFDKPLQKNGAKLKRVMYLQSLHDEASPLSEGHFDYWKKHLPEPREMRLIDATNHSFGRKKREVISHGVRWFKKYLPVKK